MIKKDRHSLARRDFLAKSSIAGIGGAIGAGAVPAWATNLSERINGPTAAVFKRHVGSRFRLNNETISHSFRLTEVVEHPVDLGRPSYVRQQPFSVFFTASKDCDFTEGTYRIQHPEFGQFEASVSPVDRATNRQTLQVVFG